MSTIRTRSATAIATTVLAFGGLAMPAVGQQEQDQEQTQEQRCVLITGLLEIPCSSSEQESSDDSVQEGTGTADQRQRQEQEQRQEQCFLCIP